MRISILLPTYRRPETLALVIEGILAQSRAPDEVVFCRRDNDEVTSAALAASVSNRNDWKVAVTAKPGVIAAMNAGLMLTTGDVVALLDDDAVPRPDWLARIEAHFLDPDLLGVGGRDIQDYIQESREGIPGLAVGRFDRLGRLLGNHHLATGDCQKVFVLKGCNCAYRGKPLREFGFDHALLGAGAQVGWEISLGFDFSRLAGFLRYDPEIIVDHLIAPRADEDTNHRGIYQAEGAYDLAHNHFSVTLRKAPFILKWRILLWDLAMGSVIAPGVLRLLDARLGAPSQRILRIRVALAAFQDAFFKKSARSCCAS